MGFKEIRAEILSNLKVGKGIFHLKLKVDKRFTADPGQFVMVRVNEGFVPLLRRPFAIFNLEGSILEISYKVVGRGTQLLSSKSPDEVLDIIGPFGKGFSIQRNKKALVVAGGIGIASVFYLLKKIKRPRLLYGARNKNELAFLDNLRKNYPDLLISTDDGSYGKMGLITSYLTEKILTGVDIIYACGPIQMLKKVASISREFNIDCQVSLEAKMACGFGVCLGCVLPARNTGGEEIDYVRVCSEGPVFDARIIDWESIH